MNTVNSWNRPLTVYTLPGNDSVTIAGHRLPLPCVSWAGGVIAGQVNQMIQLGIGGLTGNALFLNSQLILHTKNKKMGGIVKKRAAVNNHTRVRWQAEQGHMNTGRLPR